jgi:hypothetical protein
MRSCKNSISYEEEQKKDNRILVPDISCYCCSFWVCSGFLTTWWCLEQTVFLLPKLCQKEMFEKAETQKIN